MRRALLLLLVPLFVGAVPEDMSDPRANAIAEKYAEETEKDEPEEDQS